VNVYRSSRRREQSGATSERACALLEVSRAAFYEWARHAPSRRQRRVRELLDKIKSVHESKKTYGSPRVHAQLRKNGEVCGTNRVVRLMRANGIVGLKVRALQAGSGRLLGWR
jgi:putative transposase